MIICPKCNKEFENGNKFGGHYSSHFRGENFKKNRKKNKHQLDSFYVTGKHKCKYCNSEFESGQKLGAHTVWCDKKIR